MKSFVVLALTGFAGLAAAQFDQLPTCAQACANKYLANGIGNCGADAKCICSDKDFLSGIACCLAQPGGCDTADQSSAVDFASQLCVAQGVTVPSAVSCTATDSLAAATGTGTAAAGSATATTTSGAAAVSGASSGSATAANTGATTSTSSASSTSTASSSSSTAAATAATTSSSSSSSSTNYAPRQSGAAGAGLVGGLVAALAML